VVQLFRQPTTKAIGEGLELTGGILGRMQQVARSEGAPVAVVMLPIQYQLSDSTFSRLVSASEVPPAEMDIGKPQREILGLTAQLEIPTIDLLPAFQRWTADSTGRLFLETDGHWNETGHRVAAAGAAEGLVSKGLIH
jgi:hypothetical protein